MGQNLDSMPAQIKGDMATNKPVRPKDQHFHRAVSGSYCIAPANCRFLVIG